MTSHDDYTALVAARPNLSPAEQRVLSRHLDTCATCRELAQEYGRQDVAQQRFPDLSLHGKLNPPPEQALESKGSTRPWAIQSHYNHPGWYVVWRYLVDTTESIKPGHPVVIWRVDVVFLTASDWKYEGSKAGAGKGGRTHTFGVSNPAKKLAGAAAYVLPGIVIKNGKPILC